MLFHKHNQKLYGTDSETSILSARCLYAKIPEDNHEIFGIIEKTNNAHINDWIFSDKHALHSTEVIDEVVDFPDSEYANIHETSAMLQSAINLANMGRNIQKQTKSSAMVKQIPFMSSVLCQFQVVPVSVDENKEHQQRLRNNIDAWGFTIHPVVGDGNCCFSALACSLLFQKGEIVATLPTFFADIGLSLDGNISVDDLSSELRRRAVEEWCNNVDTYQGFLPEGVTVESEAQKFSQLGYFFGPLGNTMILAVSNALQLPIVVFSSAHHLPVVYTTPRVCKTSISLFVAFNQANAGHYDAVTLKGFSHHTPPTSPKRKKKCTCGKTQQPAMKQHCIEIQKKYTSMILCPCLTAKQPCSTSCICKNCNNPHGSKSQKSKMQERKRQWHAWQSTYTQEKSSMFALEHQEDISKGPCTLIEYLLVALIVKHIYQREVECTMDTVHAIYQACIAVALAMKLTIPLGAKNKKEISNILQEYEKIRKNFEAICVTQLMIDLK